MTSNERIARARSRVGADFESAVLELLWWSGDLTDGQRLEEAFAPGQAPWGRTITASAILSDAAHKVAAELHWPDLFAWLCRDADQDRIAQVAAQLAALSTDPHLAATSITHVRVCAQDSIELEIACELLRGEDFIPVVDAFLPLGDSGEIGALLRRKRALTDPVLALAYRRISRAYVTAFGQPLHPDDERDGLLDHGALADATEVGSFRFLARPRPSRRWEPPRSR